MGRTDAAFLGGLLSWREKLRKSWIPYRINKWNLGTNIVVLLVTLASHNGLLYFQSSALIIYLAKW